MSCYIKVQVPGGESVIGGETMILCINNITACFRFLQMSYRVMEKSKEMEDLCIPLRLFT